MYKDLLERLNNEKEVLNYKLFDDSLPGLEVDEGDVGYDLYVRSIDSEFRGGEDFERVHIAPGDDMYLNLNVAVQAPQGFFFQLAPRSSAYDKLGVKLTNSIGQIDPSYQGLEDEVVAHVHNTTDDVVVIQKGDRPFQLVCIPYITPETQKQEDLDGESRGGYGSTGQGV